MRKEAGMRFSKLWAGSAVALALSAGAALAEGGGGHAVPWQMGLQPGVIVGIGYPAGTRRSFDYTPAVPPEPGALDDTEALFADADDDAGAPARRTRLAEGKDRK